MLYYNRELLKACFLISICASAAPLKMSSTVGTPSIETRVAFNDTKQEEISNTIKQRYDIDDDVLWFDNFGEISEQSKIDTTSDAISSDVIENKVPVSPTIIEEKPIRVDPATISAFELRRQAAQRMAVPDFVIDDTVRSYKPTEQDQYITLKDGRYENLILVGN